ncbi:MAG: hypothetical protein KQJ78_07190 [Deltaproteobacteria bacterium]|nr:hypothetical protein [Deltaproteobacteria bacterium]
MQKLLRLVICLILLAPALPVRAAESGMVDCPEHASAPPVEDHCGPAAVPVMSQPACSCCPVGARCHMRGEEPTLLQPVHLNFRSSFSSLAGAAAFAAAGPALCPGESPLAAGPEPWRGPLYLRHASLLI